MNRFIHALQFLTVFRVRKDMVAAREDLAASMAYFPVIGALQGLILAVAFYLLTTLLPESVTTGILLLVLVLTNGGLHIDGFADTVDGLAGGATPEERLRIMRDSATGAVGVAFVVLLILIKYLAIQELPYEAKVQAIFLFPVVGRWAMVPMARWSGYARPEGGLGEAFTANSTKTLVKATVITAVLSSVLLGLLSIVILAVIGGVIYFFTRFFKKRLNGVTGDVFGFQSEVAEVLFLVSVLAMMNVLSLAEDI